jgi:hypothetical protein
MSAYHNASAGCFEGSGLIILADGVTTKRICELLPGDMVQCNICDDEKVTVPPCARVECVVRTRCSLSNSAEFVELQNGLLLTPYHPVWHEDRWQFPIDVIGRSKVLSADYVYNFVLGSSSDGHAPGQRAQAVVVNGVKCITLAHGIKNDPVAAHDFYGTDSVLKALQQYEGFQDGLVEMDERQVQRSDDSGLVCGFGSQAAASE